LKTKNIFSIKNVSRETYKKIMDNFDVIIIGAGHAGCEASLACARLGCKTLVLTMNIENIASMSCNPAIGGLAKGQIVKEIDMLGGEMAKNIDKAGIQFRVLNMTKGPAVQSSRAQADKYLYKKRMKDILERESNITIIEEEAKNILVKDSKFFGIETVNGNKFLAKSCIITTGTFLNGLMHIGLDSFPGGRHGDTGANYLSNSLKILGFGLGRLKTGTSARLDKNSIDYSKMAMQYGDNPSRMFSYLEKTPVLDQVPCYTTYTNNLTHEIILNSLEKSPLYLGKITGIGPRYCPSIEDKVVKFKDKIRHQLFIEPEGLTCNTVYVNGLSTSLPKESQKAMLKTIPGLENAKIVHFGYAIEYDFFKPTQLKANLESKNIKNLFFAGQINGTSGYEEAAGQGLIAGINAVMNINEKEPFILKRYEAYIGVLIDDLVTKGTEEPYRMFTSRAEYRLLLREDNVDQRLLEKGRDIGLVAEEYYKYYVEKMAHIRNAKEYLSEQKLLPDKDTNLKFEKINKEKIINPINLYNLLKRSNINIANLDFFDDNIKNFDELIKKQIEIEIKYEGYIEKQNQEVEKLKKIENIKIPENFNFKDIPGLTKEVQQKLDKIKPNSLGQASRISGITPAGLSVLLIYLKKNGVKINL
jgi:tRNA uridine 5-carboxymethylaminomethyl modification enzyme